MPSNLELKTLWNQQGVLGGAGESTLFYPGELGKTQWHKDASVTASGQKQPIRLRKVRRYTTDASGANLSDGALVYFIDTDGYRDFIITGDVSAAQGGSASPQFAGVARGTGPSRGNYGIIQDAGPCLVNKATTAPIADGAFLVPSTVDGEVATVASSTNGFIEVVGRALAAATTTADQVLAVIYAEPVVVNGANA